MPTSRCTLAFAIATAVACLPGCDCDDSRCISWVRLGESYQVEVLSVLEAGLRDEPYQDYPGVRSCEGLVDLDSGSRLQLIALRETDETKDCHDCQYVQARAELPTELEVVEELGIPIRVPEPWFAFRGRVRMSADCEGQYSLGVMPIRPEFIAQQPAPVPSDHALVRELRRFTATCGPTEAVCWDSWYVRITDQDGVQISQDMPEPSR